VTLLTMQQASERFGVSRNTLRAAANRGTLPARKLGAQWVLEDGEVAHWLAHGKHVPGRAPKDRPPKRRSGRPRRG
jgi:excisionase family DNA binding protein